MIRGAIMPKFGLSTCFEFGDDALGQHLAKLYAPLIERVDLPDGALREDAVLVEGDQFSEGFRCQSVGKNRVGHAVAFEDSMRQEPLRRSLGTALLRNLTEGPRFSLREDICQKQVMMAAKFVEWVKKRYKVARNQPGSLMDQLVERMLPVCAR